MMKYDSLIFDMDGTLWDNVNAYVKAWNVGLEKTGHDVRAKRDDMLGLMGKEFGVIINTFIPESSDSKKNELMHAVFKAYDEMADSIEPTIFPDVLDGLEKLSKKYKLFLLSNCEENGLVKFMNHTRTAHLITDYMEYGQNFQLKSFNLKLLIERNNLQSTIYIGDTDSDCRESKKAGVPFAFMSYGFGNTENYDLKFDSFRELVEYFMGL